MNTLITIASLLTGMASMALFICGINWLYGTPGLVMLNPTLAFPAATTLLLVVVFAAMYLDAEERRGLA